MSLAELLNQEIIYKNIPNGEILTYQDGIYTYFFSIYLSEGLLDKEAEKCTHRLETIREAWKFLNYRGTEECFEAFLSHREKEHRKVKTKRQEDEQKLRDLDKSLNFISDGKPLSEIRDKDSYNRWFKVFEDWVVLNRQLSHSTHRKCSGGQVCYCAPFED